MAQSGAGPSKSFKRTSKNSPCCEPEPDKPEWPLSSQSSQHKTVRKASRGNVKVKSILKGSRNDSKETTKKRKRVSWDEDSIQAIQRWYQAQNLSSGCTVMPSLAESDMEITEQSASSETDTLQKPHPHPEPRPHPEPEQEQDREQAMSTHPDNEQPNDPPTQSQLGDQEDSCKKGPDSFERWSFEELRRAHQKNSCQFVAHTLKSKEEEDDGEEEDNHANVEDDDCPAGS